MALGLGFNKAKILQSAEKYVLQGKLPAAIGEYQKILKKDPKDLLTLNTVGDLYVRDNDTFNQDLIRHIEKAGAEVITVPFIDSVNMLAERHFQTQWEDGRYIHLLRDKVAYNMLTVFSRKLNAIAQPILNDRSC